jgi:hypothetical protein
MFQDGGGIRGEQQLEPHHCSAGPAFREYVIQKNGHFMRRTVELVNYPINPGSVHDFPRLVLPLLCSRRHRPALIAMKELSVLER